MSCKLRVVAILIFLLLTIPAYAATFKGKVIDADTKQPIEGAVVVAAWHEATATVAGESTRLKDVKETLTGKNGEWAIKGPKGRWSGNITAIFTFLTGTYYTRPPQFIIFKPAYCSWSIEAFGIDACREKLKPTGMDGFAKGETVEIPKLTNKEDRLRNLPGPINGREKQKEFIRLINEESRYLGLRKY